MSGVITKKVFPAPPLCTKEVLRYAGCREADAGVLALLDDCVREAEDKLTYGVLWRRLPVAVAAEACDFGLFRVCSRDLARALRDCREAVVLAATVGVGMDRLIARYGRVQPSRALMLQALGAERIEALCDTFCRDFSRREQVGLLPRFSPGYGDLPLDAQRDIFAVLDCGRQLGLSLNDSLLISPTKSVTAFAGITGAGTVSEKNKCASCQKQDCAFRGAL